MTDQEGTQEHAGETVDTDRGQYVSSTPSDGQAAFEEFRAEFAYPEFCLPTLGEESQDRDNEYHRIWYIWRGWCQKAKRNPNTGELTDAGRRAKDAAERAEKQAQAAISFWWNFQDVESQLDQSVETFRDAMAKAEVTQ